MNLIPHAWTTFKYAWSIRFNVAAGLLILLEPLIQDFVADLTFQSPWIRVFVRLGIGLLNVASIWAKLTFQPKLQRKITEKEAVDGEPFN